MEDGRGDVRGLIASAVRGGWMGLRGDRGVEDPPRFDRRASPNF